MTFSLPKEIRFLNLTNHDVHLYDKTGKRLLHTFPQLEKPARVVAKARQTKTEHQLPFPTHRRLLEAVENLPDQEPNVYLIVSSIILNHPSLGFRDDLLSPDTSPKSAVYRLTRPHEVIGVRGFQLRPAYLLKRGVAERSGAALLGA